MSAMAQEYTLNELNDKAIAFFEQTDTGRLRKTWSSFNTGRGEIFSPETIGRDGKDYMYVFNRADSEGWVIFSNEKQYVSIIAYSNSGHFSYDEYIPSAMQAIIEQHMDAIDSTRLYGPKEKKTITIQTGNSDYYCTDYLLGDMRWMQDGNNGSTTAECDKVYNKYMPKYGCEYCDKTPAGCGAITVAQIMRYWRWPDYVDVAEKSILSVGYGKVRRWFDWEAMVDTLANNTPMYNVDAVAGLIRDVANGILTTFTCSGSAAEMNYIYDNIQENLLYHAKKTTNTDNVDFDSLLRAEIDAKRPVIVQAWKGVSAHTFVVEAYSVYKGAVLYRINWGWGYSAFSDITFGGYNALRSCLSQVYPNCSKRQQEVSIDTMVTIHKDDARTYYSGTSVNVCAKNNDVIVQQDGHLTIKAGEQIVLRSGFHAQQGSYVLLSIANPCDDAKILETTDQRRYLTRYEEKHAETDEPSWETSSREVDTFAVHNVMRKECNAAIDYALLYSINGQLLQTFHGIDIDISTLPSGFYVLQKHMTDGSVVSETIIHT